MSGKTAWVQDIRRYSSREEM